MSLVNKKMQTINKTKEKPQFDLKKRHFTTNYGPYKAFTSSLLGRKKET